MVVEMDYSSRFIYDGIKAAERASCWLKGTVQKFRDGTRTQFF